MDQTKTGGLIRALRTQKGLTQKALAEAIGVGDKAVSKWERGLGCPDVSLLPEISRVLGVGLETLLSGSLDANDQERGNMKKLNFYVCPDCGNLITAATGAGVSCCGRTLLPLEPQKPEEPLSVEKIDDSWFVSSPHDQGPLRLLRGPAHRRHPVPPPALPRVGPANPHPRLWPRDSAVVLHPTRAVPADHLRGDTPCLTNSSAPACWWETSRWSG